MVTQINVRMNLSPGGAILLFEQSRIVIVYQNAATLVLIGLLLCIRYQNITPPGLGYMYAN